MSSDPHASGPSMAAELPISDSDGLTKSATVASAATSTTQVFRAPDGKEPIPLQKTKTEETGSQPSEGAASGGAPPTPSDEELNPTLEDVRAHYSSLAKRSKVLNNRPLELRGNREEAKQREQTKKADRWPSTTIRVRFPDQTQIQSSFPSTSKMPAVYDFVRSSLADEYRNQPFTLYEPPNKPCYEIPPAPSKEKQKQRSYLATAPPPVSITLLELELVPQAVLVVKFADDSLNRSDRPAPLRPDLMEQAAPLPPPKTFDGDQKSTGGGSGSKPTGEKKMPKWLEKSLGKKK